MHKTFVACGDTRLRALCTSLSFSVAGKRLATASASLYTTYLSEKNISILFNTIWYNLMPNTLIQAYQLRFIVEVIAYFRVI
jgi:hypothetical protein